MRLQFRLRPAMMLMGILLLGGSLLSKSAIAAREERPNIVLLYADDLGYGDLSCQNPESRIATPHLDRLAAEGLRFTDAHSSSGVCTPSRYALLTGRFHWRKFHGIVNSFDPPALDPDEKTLPETLRAQGYRTACIGKWHLGWSWNDLRAPGAPPLDATAGPRNASEFDWSRRLSGGPLSHGFQSYFGDDVPNFPPYAWFENDRLISRPSVPLTLPPPPTEGAWETRAGPMTPGWDFHAVVPRLADRSVAWIMEQRRNDAPFFLYLPFNSPHAPIVPAAEFRGRSQAGPYGDFVVQTDAIVGRILEALDRTGLRDRTLVIFSSDNGPEGYAYPRLRTYGHRSAGPWRGLKRDLYEGGHRVPLLVRWPGVIQPGRTSDALVSQVDLMATLASVVGAALRRGEAEDSYDLLPLLKGAPRGPRRAIVHNTMENAYALRRDQWVLIAHRTGAHTPEPAWLKESHGLAENAWPGELYDLRSDPGQRHNLYAQEPRLVDRLMQHLARIRTRGQVR